MKISFSTKLNSCLSAVLAAILVSICFSCVAVPKPQEPSFEEEEILPDDTIIIEPVEVPLPVSRNLSDKPVKNAGQLYAFFLSQNPEADPRTVSLMSELYIEECAIEGINSDCAFVQMCLETGFLRFGGLVTPDMHNYCGLGAIDIDHPGEVFETEQLGVRAHIQHLHAYATTEDHELVNECIDRRYRYVNPRGKAPTVFELAGTWAADKKYGEKLDALLTRLEAF